jgi:hypothetical protein
MRIAAIIFLLFVAAAPVGVAFSADKKEQSASPVDTKAALQKQVSFSMLDSPFEECIGFLRSKTGAKITFDEKLLEQGLHKSPITLDGKNIQAEAALNSMCKIAGASAQITKDGVVITLARK